MSRVKYVAVACYWFGLLPVLVVWCAVSVVALYTYAVKGIVFLATGTASVIGATGPVAMVSKHKKHFVVCSSIRLAKAKRQVPAPMEAAMGLALGIVTTSVFILFRYYSLQSHYSRSDSDVPLMEMLAAASPSSRDPMVVDNEELDLTGAIEQLNTRSSRRNSETRPSLA